jgi:hypothetical protein
MTFVIAAQAKNLNIAMGPIFNARFSPGVGFAFCDPADVDCRL